MHGERVGLRPSLFQSILSLAQRLAEVRQRVPKPICSHTVQTNISEGKRQFLLARPTKLPATLWRPLPPNVNPPPLSCARISAELMALENERWVARLSDPRYRVFLAGLFRMSSALPPPPRTSVDDGAFLRIKNYRNA